MKVITRRHQIPGPYGLTIGTDASLYLEKGDHELILRCRAESAEVLRWDQPAPLTPRRSPLVIRLDALAEGISFRSRDFDEVERFEGALSHAIERLQDRLLRYFIAFGPDVEESTNPRPTLPVLAA